MSFPSPYATLFCLIVLLGGLQVVPPWLGAQPREESGGLLDLYPAGDDYFFEIVSLPGPSTNRTRVVALFSLTHNLMTFRADRRGTRGGYSATPRLYVEAIDHQGVVAGYGKWSDTITAEGYGSTLSKRERAHGFVEMDLRPGIYTFRYSIDQGAPATGFTEETDTVEVPDLGGRTTAFGTPLFLDRVEETGEHRGEIVPLGLDGNAAFGHPFRLFVTGRSPDQIFRLEYRVHMVDAEGALSAEVLRGDAEGFGGEGSIVGSIRVQEGTPRVDVVEAEGGGGFAMLIDDPAPQLAPGDYRLILSLDAESGRHLDSMDFQVRWIDRPLSLGDPTYAIRALRPIATDEEIDPLLSGSAEKKGEALEKFWQAFDPTPGTLFNEKMAAYYRRVDYAYFNFATFAEPDGSKTDRGKIYILYGPPTDVVRQLDPDGGPREVWTYDNAVGRTFIFRDRSESGEYRLVEYYDL